MNTSIGLNLDDTFGQLEGSKIYRSFMGKALEIFATWYRVIFALRESIDLIIECRIAPAII